MPRLSPIPAFPKPVLAPYVFKPQKGPFFFAWFAYFAVHSAFSRLVQSRYSNVHPFFDKNSHKHLTMNILQTNLTRFQSKPIKPNRGKSSYFLSPKDSN